MGEADAEVLLQLDAQPSVHDQVVAGYETGLPRTEKGDRAGDLLRLAAPPERVLLLEEGVPAGILLPHVLLDVLRHNVARADCIHANAARAQFNQPSDASCR